VVIFYALLLSVVLFGLWRMIRNRDGYVEGVTRGPKFDESEGQPEVSEALELLRADDWVGLTSLYGRLTPSDRYHLIYSLGRMAPAPTLPGEANSAMLTITGGMRIIQGMKLEGKGPVRSVVRANAERMRQDISNADRELREATSQSPDDSTALAFQMLTEVAGMRDTSRINNLVGRAQASGEDNLYAAVNHLIASSPMLGRSTSEMWRVANEWANSGPNAAWLAIPARAHIEEWTYAMHACPPGSPDRVTMTSLLQDDDFKRHLASLDDKFWASLRQAPISGAEHSFAHNHFAFLMHVFRVDDRARRHLEQVGEHMSRYPWRLLPTGAAQPAQLLADLRKQYSL
jgi:hypothetical protein